MSNVNYRHDRTCSPDL